ncbi:hypothetical protein DV515_00015505 [Chloebia gouldiae]|uniref:RNase H type-1 domain-containing protein n=1 Tax=Chloebia gouldiae TaxID=44316 RepID=A0A3L8RVL2_CHLGU|nr:hypothetical protein DV515_00015505 [Chloebia gouldiae]
MGGYKVSKEKAQIAQQTVIYLGCEISQGQQKLSNYRIQAICAIPEPQNLHELRVLLGMTGWCHLWITDYGLIAKPLCEAQKTQPFTWGKPQKEAFLKLKEALTTAPALGLPDLPKDFQLFVHERLRLALGVLTQCTTSEGSPLEHDCMEVIEHTCAARADLKEVPLEQPDWELFTDGSNFMENGIRHAGYVVTTISTAVEARALPPNTSAQKAELVALTRALELGEGEKVNIWTYSKYAFGIVHVHGAVWREQGLLSSQGMHIKHQDAVLQLIRAVQKSEQVAIMHCKAHQSGNSKICEGSRKADWTAQQAS